MAWRFSTRASVATALSVHSTHAFPAVYGLTQRPGQNGCHFADNICECIFFHENVCCCIAIKKSLKFVLEGPINNIPALASLMAWCCPDNKPLSRPMVVSLLLQYASLGLNGLSDCMPWSRWSLLDFSRFLIGGHNLLHLIASQGWQIGFMFQNHHIHRKSSKKVLQYKAHATRGLF